MRGVLAEFETEHSRRPLHQLFQLLVRVEIQMGRETESGAQRRRQHTFTRGGANHGETGQCQRNG